MTSDLVRTIDGLLVVPCRVNGPRGVVKAAVLYDANSAVVIDTGASDADGDRMIDALLGQGFTSRQVAQCILTHHHRDHVGGLRKIWEWSHCTVVAHMADAERIENETGVPVTTRIEDEVTLRGLGDVKVLPCPGHTSGSLVVYDARTQTLIAGDAVFSAGEWLVPPPPFLSDNTALARQSISQLLERQWPIVNVIVGHGEDVYGWGAESLGYSILTNRPW